MARGDEKSARMMALDAMLETTFERMIVHGNVESRRPLADTRYGVLHLECGTRTTKGVLYLV